MTKKAFDRIMEGATEAVTMAQLMTENERLREALHRIAHSPNGPKTYCRDGHEEAVLIAREAIRKGK